MTESSWMGKLTSNPVLKQSPSFQIIIVWTNSSNLLLKKWDGKRQTASLHCTWKEAGLEPGFAGWERAPKASSPRELLFQLIIEKHWFWCSMVILILYNDGASGWFFGSAAWNAGISMYASWSLAKIGYFDCRKASTYWDYFLNKQHDSASFISI